MPPTPCKNLKPSGEICGVPIEWREIEGGKKRPFEMDTGQQHYCPYWKPKVKFGVPPDIKQEFAKIEKEVTEGTETSEIKKSLATIEELCKAILVLVQQWPKASDIK